MPSIPLERPLFLDSTLRDGEQAPRVHFTLAEKLELALGLDHLGVDVIEAGVPAMGGTEAQLFGELAARGLRAEVLAWNRLSVGDVEASLRSGATSLHISVPSSDVQLDRKLGRTRQQVLGDLEALVALARREGARVSVGAEDASRADEDFLIELFQRAAAAGAHRVRYADTLGLLDPEGVAARVGALVGELSVPLDFHGHNDFGLATANALSAWKAGARVLSCTLLGLGERAGNSALEEVAAAVQLLNGVALGWDFAVLKRLCHAVSRSSGRSIPAAKPLYGSSVFTHESGIHVDGLLKDPQNYEAWKPGVFGGRRHLVLGKHSGVASALEIARRWKLPLTPELAPEFLAHLRNVLETDKQASPHAVLESFLRREHP